MSTATTECQNGHEHTITVPGDPSYERLCPDCGERLFAVDTPRPAPVEYHADRETCICEHCVEYMTGAYVRHLKACVAARKASR